jgi:phosphatidylglycerophosphate synthase
MLDAYIRPYIDPCLNTAARGLAKTGLRANMVTGLGFLLSLGGFTALALQRYGWALGFIVASRVMDGLDGPLARQSRPTDLGGFLDIVSDFIFYAGTVFFFAVGRPEAALPAAFLIFSFIGTGSSFLAYAILAAKHGTTHSRQGAKAFFYLGGLTEGTESIAVLLLICLIPAHFAVVAWIFGGLCWLTTLERVRKAVADFGNFASRS